MSTTRYLITVILIGSFFLSGISLLMLTELIPQWVLKIIGLQILIVYFYLLKIFIDFLSQTKHLHKNEHNSKF